MSLQLNVFNSPRIGTSQRLSKCRYLFHYSYYQATELSTSPLMERAFTKCFR
ncbi:MAG: hypothetical protein N3E36_01310 [Sulfolobales archaeon]|nr:hypothetical protein [Sulfolobales archaeon]